MGILLSAADGTSSLLRDVRPPVTIHAPSIWTDTFSNFSFDHQVQQKYAEEIDTMKEEARVMLMAAPTPLKQLILIDTLERLGLAYHFQTEIDHKLQQISNTISGDDYCDYLLVTSLRFRLLRQHQYPISCNVFDKFVDKDGKFKETLSSDVEGLLSLYEAAHVRFHDENILEEAARFTRHKLSCHVESLLETPLKERVKRALERPFHKEATFFYARIFISIYQRDDSRDELLLKLATVNFNYLQMLYKNDLLQLCLCRWWNKFDLKTKLVYTRDRVAEAYVWSVGYHYEPHYSYARIGVAKAVVLATILDDTYDNYATLNEAQLLTQALDRWNIEDELPDYMKVVLHFIMSIYEDYELEAAQGGKQFAVPYLKETVQELSRAYNQELKWVMERQMPSFQEYAQNAMATSCVNLIFACTIPGLRSVNQETINWIKSDSKFVISAAMMGRYWNDIGSSQRESKGGEMLTAVDCYMKQYGLSKQETLSKFAEEIEDKYWRTVNEEWVAMAALPKETIGHLLSYARMCEATYNINNGDGYSDSKLSQARITSLFVDPIYKLKI